MEHRYPAIGKERPFAIQTLKMLQQEGHLLILWTVRERETLDEAVAWCQERGLTFYAVNKDYPEEDSTAEGYSRKLKADLFIDDRSFGGIPDWGFIYHRIRAGRALESAWSELATLDDTFEPRRPSLWQRLFG